jgi:hypothetical protein
MALHERRCKHGVRDKQAGKPDCCETVPAVVIHGAYFALSRFGANGHPMRHSNPVLCYLNACWRSFDT